jgi:adenylate cyclase
LADAAVRRLPGSHRTRRRLLRGAAVAACVALPVLALRGTGAMEAAEARSYDLRVQRLTPPPPPDPGFAIVAIDDNSLEVYRDALGRWPWPRDVYAPVLAYLDAAGARLVVFDVLFPEPDRADPEGDAAFAEAIRTHGRVVLPMTFSPGDPAAAAEWDRLRAAEDGARRPAEARIASAAMGAAPDGGAAMAYAEPPLEAFADGAVGLGAANVRPDRDGVLRRQHLAYAFRGGLYPSLPLAAARVLEPERFGGPVEAGGGLLTVGRERVPLDGGELIVRWRGAYLEEGRATYPVYPAFHLLNSYQQVLQGVESDVPLEALRGKVVFVALTGVGLLDARSTPLRPHEPGVLVHATILDNLLRGEFMRRASPAANAAAVVAAALAVALATALLGSAAAAGMVSLVLLAGVLTAASLAYASGVWLDLAAPVLAGGLAFAGTMAANYVAEGRDKARVRQLFSRYVSPEYVRRLADSPGDVRLGGERVPITVLFSDIRGFTALSERLPAEAVIEVLNEYLGAMSAVVFRHGGTLDKFIGDAVMAFWGAPVAVDDHARRAMDAALEMLDELDSLNARWESRGAPTRLRIGIGIHTGDAVVGNIGSLAHKLDYTAIGDTVNLASRLETLTKELDAAILTSPATRGAVGNDAYDFRSKGEVHVKGKEEPVHVYTVHRHAPTPPAGSEAARPARAGAVALALAAALGAFASDVAAQPAERAQWNVSVYQPGAWQGGRLVPLATANPRTDTLALVARVDLYSRAPAWRAEIQPVTDGGELQPPVVLVSTGRELRVVTAVGSAPLAGHAAAEDPVVQAVVRQFDAAGRLNAPQAGRYVERRPTGEVGWVILRQPVARAQVPDRLFETGRGSILGRRAAQLGIRAAGGERDQEVVASAAARGVVTVRTIDGEITIRPDTAAVQRMDAFAAGPVALDRFLREGRIGPYAREDETVEEVAP